MLSDWDLIVATCNWNGSCNRILSGEARARVWEKGDGFGQMSAAELAKIIGLDDWSHLRDSSAGAKFSVARQIRKELANMDLDRALKFGNEIAFQTHEETVEETVAKLGLQNEVAR